MTGSIRLRPAAPSGSKCGSRPPRQSRSRSARRATSRPTAPAGATASTPANGKRRSPPMPSPSSASSQCRRLTPRLCSRCWSLSGRKSRRRPAVCADVWSRSSIGQRCAAKGHLDHLLPARGKVRKVEHHAALPYTKLPSFLVALREQEGIAARALEFTILTAARTGETIGATWDEINWTDKIWIIRAERMKSMKEHRVPLCDRTLAILREMKPADDAANAGEQFVFPGSKAGRPLSNMAFLMLLRRMGHGDLTTHGFRSSFRDWAAERTHFP